MNPKEFGWAEDQQVTVTNPTGKDYPFKVHNKDYELKAGETAKMPGYIAWVYVYGLSVRMCQEAGEFNRWNEEGFRQKYYDKVVVGADDVIEKIEVQPAIERIDTNEEDTDEDENSSEHNEDKPTNEPTQARRTRRGRHSNNR